MILTTSYLEAKARDMGITERNYESELNESVYHFAATKTYDLFISHSYLDKKLVSTLAKLFEESGYSVYIDWLEDTELDRDSVTPKTAKKLKERMNNSQGLAYIATSNTSSSKWCPWELGYFDAKKDELCCILPVLATSTSVFDGQEYLGLYPYLEYNDYGQFYVLDNVDKNKFVSLSSWLRGNKPYNH